MRRKSRYTSALSHDLQLGDGIWTLEVGCHQNGGVSVFAQMLCQLSGQGGFTRALQTRKHDHRGRALGELQFEPLPAPDLPESFAHSVYDLLRRIQRGR